VTSEPIASTGGEIVIEREFTAPPAAVFEQWIRAEHVREWFAPDTYVTTTCELDFRRGGRYRLDYRSDGGHVYHEQGEFLEIDPPSRLVMTLTQVEQGRASPETVVTVTFAERDGRTLMSFRQTGFESRERRDGNADGWRGCFDKLERALGS
jgi:uncharacterized protein YndB with AHSA1/START domain